jgi:hypothetical protein
MNPGLISFPRTSRMRLGNLIRCAVARAVAVACLVAVIGPPARAQGEPDRFKKLAPVFQHGGDACLEVTFSVKGTLRTPSSSLEGESRTESITVDWEAAGLVEVRTQAEGNGILQIHVVGTPSGALTGHLTESHQVAIRGIYGEGGLSEYTEDLAESWKAPHVDFPRFPGVCEIRIYLDQRTWWAPELADAFDGFIPLLHENETYEASWVKRAGTEGFQGGFSYNKHEPPPGLYGDSPIRLSQLGAPMFELHEILYSPVPLGIPFNPAPLSSMDKREGEADLLFGSVEGHFDAKQNGKTTARISWRLIRELPEIELRVTAPDLERWRPQGDRLPPVEGRLPGPGLLITAEVVDPARAEPPRVRIRRLRWWLEDTSRLPGVCMNWPYGSTDTSPDLEIDHDLATDERQRLELTNLTTLRKTIRVVPFDWGGTTTLRVEAELDDGRKLQGRLKGQSGDETAIRIPARDENSRIASYLKRKWGAANPADDEDGDFFPLAGPDGDGFTAFEEYRGFYVHDPQKGDTPVHVSSHPQSKTVFVYDRIDDTHTRNGISLFRSASGACVFLVKPGQRLLDDSRVMNRNRGDAPTRGDQHAIGIRRSSGWSSAAPGGPGTAEVAVPPFAEIVRLHRSKASARLYERAIAQRLFMACHVPRPGDGDRMMTLTVSRGADGGPVVKTDDGEPVSLRDERTGHDLGEDWLRKVEQHAKSVAAVVRGTAGATAESAEKAGRAAAEVLATRTYFVAVRGGQHSGPLGNIMRSAYADAYFVEETNTIVVLSTPPVEQLGSELSKTSEGDGYNAPDYKQPRPRYGSSPNPPARSQFSVSDHLP